MRSAAEDLFEKRSEIEECLQFRRFADIVVGAQSGSICSVLLCIRGRQNDNWYRSAPLTAPDPFQNFASWSPGKVQIDDHQIKAIDRLSIELVNKLYRGLTIRHNEEAPFDAVLFKCHANQTRIGRVILD